MIRTICLALAMFACTSLAWAQDCRPLRMVVGRAPGGGTDMLARLIAQRFTAKSGVTVIVDNKVGAGGNIAAAYVAKAPPDGCALLVTGNWHILNLLIYTRPGYELKDFAPVARAAEGTTVLLVNAEQPFTSLPALVEYAKAHPGKLSYSSSGIGSGNHLAMELFLKAAGIDIVHVPYKGAAPALLDTIAGNPALSMSSAVAAQPHVASRRLRALAVSASTRWPALPDVPTMAEAGFGAATTAIWMGIVAPAATPLALREKLNNEFRAILAEKAVSDRLRTDGYEPASGNVIEFDTFLKEDYRVNQHLVQELKLKVE